MNRAVCWLLLVVLLGGFAAAAYAVLRQRAEAGKGLPEYSVWSEEPDGRATAARVLRRLGVTPVAPTRPDHHTRHRGLLVMVEPKAAVMFPGQKPELGDNVVNGVLDWVHRGNALLLVGRRATALHRKLGVDIASDVRAAREKRVRRAELCEAGAYTDQVTGMEVEGHDVVQAPGGLPLWWEVSGPGAVVLRHGRGYVLVVPDPSLLTARGLPRQDNVVFLYNVARRHAHDGRVYFDEYHHGL